MCDKLINFFFKIEENVAPNENTTMSISLDIKSRFGDFGLFLWFIIEAIREKLEAEKWTTKKEKRNFINYQNWLQ